MPQCVYDTSDQEDDPATMEQQWRCPVQLGEHEKQQYRQCPFDRVGVHANRTTKRLITAIA